MNPLTKLFQVRLIRAHQACLLLVVYNLRNLYSPDTQISFNKKNAVSTHLNIAIPSPFIKITCSVGMHTHSLTS